MGLGWGGETAMGATPAGVAPIASGTGSYPIGAEK